MFEFRIEAGLPPYGPTAMSFPDPRGFREGFVVTFTTTMGEKWTGNFGRGFGSLSTVRDGLGSKATIVVSCGAGYVVDVDGKRASKIMEPVEYIDHDPDQRLIIVGNGLWFEGVGASGTVWRSRRISWDGMRNLQSREGKLVGEAFTPIGPPDWCAFELDLATGYVAGGSYNGPS